MYTYKAYCDTYCIVGSVSWYVSYHDVPVSFHPYVKYSKTPLFARTSLCHLWSIAAHRDHFIWCLSICSSVCPVVTLSWSPCFVIFSTRHMHSLECCHSVFDVNSWTKEMWKFQLSTLMCYGWIHMIGSDIYSAMWYDICTFCKILWNHYISWGFNFCCFRGYHQQWIYIPNK